jgi:endonuclease I
MRIIFQCNSHRLWLILLAASLGNLAAQTPPQPQPLPYTQDFGTGLFSTLPAGVAAWSGLSGGSISSSASAGNSAPSSDATPVATTAVQTAGGSFGFATSSNARFYVQTSGNTSSGANQLAVAVNTSGHTSVTLGYDVEIISAQARTIGILCQFRIGDSGSWTTISPTSGSNSYSQAGGTTGVKTTVLATLSAAADNQPNVQIRWATWRGNESGNSSGAAIDNISIRATALTNSLSLSAVPDSFSESAGANACLVTVTSASPAAADLTITLVSTDTGEAIVPQPNPSIIPAGQSSVTFQLTAADDLLLDGNQTFALQASAPGAGTATTNITVIDDEDAWSPPAGYYAAAAGLSGNPLKSALHSIIANGHVQYSYSNTYNPLRAIYADPANSGNVLTTYSGTSIPKNDSYYPGGSADPNTTWSREHAWPDSFGLDPTNVNPGSTDGNAGADFTDLFNLRPVLQTVNSQRGNKYYDTSSGTVSVPPLAPACSYDSNSFEPRDVEKGDIARAMFYMATRYDGSEPLTLDLEIDDSPAAATGRFAKLSTLLKWHEQDPVSIQERQRNQLIHTTYQHNRNPFVDHPEFVAMIWGRLLVDKEAASVTEGGATDTYNIVLTSQPSSDVTVDISQNPAAQVTVNLAAVTFTPANWNQPIAIIITAVDDSAFESPQQINLVHGFTTSDPYYSTLASTSLPVTVIDDDPVIASATLPLNYGGPWNPLPAVGFLGSGIGTYSGSLGNDTGDGSARFDNTNDRLTISYDGQAATLAYNLRGNPSSGTATEGTFLVQESVDGITFTTLATITNKNNTDQAFVDHPAPATRFISFVYSLKTGGNIQLDKLSITPATSAAWLALYGIAAFGRDTDKDGLMDLAEYGLGGSPAASDLTPISPVVTRLSGALRITAVIRTNDSSLHAKAQTCADLTSPGSWTESGVTKITPVDQTGVAPGFERLTFEVSDSGSGPRFLRLWFGLD